MMFQISVILNKCKIILGTKFVFKHVNARYSFSMKADGSKRKPQ